MTRPVQFLHRDWRRLERMLAWHGGRAMGTCTPEVLVAKIVSRHLDAWEDREGVTDIDHPSQYECLECGHEHDDCRCPAPVDDDPPPHELDLAAFAGRLLAGPYRAQGGGR